MLVLQRDEYLFWRQIGKLIGSLGQDEFTSELLITLNKMFRVDLCAVFPLDSNDRPTGIMAASRPTPDLARELTSRFCSKHWHGDAAILGGWNPLRGCSPRHWRTRWTDVPSEAIKRELYCRVGIVEKMSTWLSLSSGSIIWSVYRRDKFFTQNEFDLFRETSDVISTTIAKHLRISDIPLPMDDGRTDRPNLLSSIERRGPRLSRRESEVCEGIARGKTTNVIAHELGIKISSVLTYKKRIYEKLGVSTQRELLAVMLRESTSRRDLGNVAATAPLIAEY